MALKFGIIGKFKNLFANYYESVMSQSAEQSPTLPLRRAELLCPAGAEYAICLCLWCRCGKLVKRAIAYVRNNDFDERKST